MHLCDCYALLCYAVICFTVFRDAVGLLGVILHLYVFTSSPKQCMSHYIKLSQINDTKSLSLWSKNMGGGGGPRYNESCQQCLHFRLALCFVHVAADTSSSAPDAVLQLMHSRQAIL